MVDRKDIATGLFARSGDSADTFRRAFGPMSESTKADVGTIKTLADGFLSEIQTAYRESFARNDPADVRALAIAQTNLETAVMWAVKGLTK
jgi:hypothetical protein